MLWCLTIAWSREVTDPALIKIRYPHWVHFLDLVLENSLFPLQRDGGSSDGGDSSAEQSSVPKNRVLFTQSPGAEYIHWGKFRVPRVHGENQGRGSSLAHALFITHVHTAGRLWSGKTIYKEIGYAESQSYTRKFH